MPKTERIGRVAVITSEIGIRSEVWILRQLQAFTRLEPVLFGWSRASDGLKLPDGLEIRQFDLGDTRTPHLQARISRRLGLAGGYLPDSATRRSIRRTLEAANVDVVLCHFAWNAIPVAAAIGDGLPLVVHVHGRDVSKLLEQPAYRAALKPALARADHLIAVGSFQLENLKRLGLRDEHSLIPCGAPTELFGAAPAPVREEGQPIRFVSVGRISHEKGVLQTLRAFELLHRSYPQSELVFVGAGPADAELDAAIAASPAAGAVRRTGYLTPEELARLLATCHAQLQHSREVDGWVEGFGVTLTEGGASGLPLIASRSGGIPDQLQDGVNGLLFAVDDVEAQARAMLELAGDEPLRQRMGLAAREIAIGFDAGRMATKVEDLLIEQIARSRAAGVGRG